MKERINIMTSCDENYAGLIPVQLLSIADNLLGSSAYVIYEVHFYFFHSRVSKEKVESLNIYCDALGIVFHEVCITDIEPYNELASKGGGWCYEAYFPFDCHCYLPPEVDRIMYIDAADVLIIGDIGEFYFADFEDKTIHVTCSQYKTLGSGKYEIFNKSDLGKADLLTGILRGIFNSGSFVINLEKMRRKNVSIYDYVAIKRDLESIYPGKNPIYHGDQGLLGASLIGDIKYWGYPQIKDLWYQPYNFCIWFFDRSTEMCGGNPWYTPKVLHFAGGIKPWLITSKTENETKPGQWPYYKIYKLYDNQVPPEFK